MRSNKEISVRSAAGTARVTLDIDGGNIRLEELLKRVTLGEEVNFVQGHEPVAQLRPLMHKRTRVPGGAAGLEISSTFFEPLPDSVLQSLT